MIATETIKESAVSFLKLCASGHVSEAYDSHVGTRFRHHNAYFASDAESLRKGMQESADESPGKVLDVQRAIQEGDLVAVHSRLRQGAGQPEVAVVHILRFEDGKIVEFWDVAQVALEPMINELGMF